MENLIDKLYEILTTKGISKKSIRKVSTLSEYIEGDTTYDKLEFVYKKVTYSIQIEDFDTGEIQFGPDSFDNHSLTIDYLHDNHTEYGLVDDFEDYVDNILYENPMGELYKITEKLLQIEEVLETELHIDVPTLLKDMFGYE